MSSVAIVVIFALCLGSGITKAVKEPDAAVPTANDILERMAWDVQVCAESSVGKGQRDDERRVLGRLTRGIRRIVNTFEVRSFHIL